MRAVAVCLLVGALGTAAPAVASAAPPPGACLSEIKPREVRTDRPWEDRLLDSARVWSVTKGAGVRVGVVDSGVDADNPQLRGKVFPGHDFVRNTDGARFDCAPHGTAVASIIVGEKMDGTGFHGIAPDARIVPARISDTDAIEGGPAIVAAAIRYTVDSGVKVLNLSLTLFEDVPEVRQAVDYARQHDVLLIAAAGNAGEDGNPTPYPAAYPGVLGVGSIDISGAKAPDSQTGDFVDLVAPGVKVTGCSPSAGHQLWQGTSFATPFVAGTAALVRSVYPELTADQVYERLIRTATVARGGGDRSPEYGTGLVNPYRAVTDTTVVGEEPPVAQAPVAGPETDVVAEKKAAETVAADRSARGTTTVLLVTTLGALAIGGLLLAGRRRDWTPRRRQ